MIASERFALMHAGARRRQTTMLGFIVVLAGLLNAVPQGARSGVALSATVNGSISLTERATVPAAVLTATDAAKGAVTGAATLSDKATDWDKASMRSAMSESAAPDPAAIRAEVRSILSDPRFAPRKTAWQWFAERFSNWNLPNVNLPPGLKKALLWVLIVWCLLALLAILAHFVWTLVILFGGRGSAGRVRSGSITAERLRHRSLEELSGMMREFAERGEFREALGIMMVALLKRLDLAGALRFHESKTNGEYVLEYPRERLEREDFKQFVFAYERTVYGGDHCEPERYEGMCSLFERIRGHVEQRPQV